jgi:hypothetical protein
MMEEQGVDDEVAQVLVHKDIRKDEQAKKAVRAFKRRKTEEQSQMHSQEGEIIWETVTHMCRATTTRVWQGFQSMMQGLPGVIRRARQGDIYFADIKDPRVPNAVRAGTNCSFRRYDDCSFILDLAARLPEDRRQAYVEQVLARFRREGSVTLKRANIRQVGSSCTD